MERIAQLYKELTGREPQRITPLAGAGSNRQYFRVEGEGESLIAVIGTNQEENEAFIDLSKRFKQGNLPVPAVLAVSDDHRKIVATSHSLPSWLSIVRRMAHWMRLPLMR